MTYDPDPGFRRRQALEDTHRSRNGRARRISPLNRALRDAPSPAPRIKTYHISAMLDDGTIVDLNHRANVDMQLENIMARFGRGTMFATPRGQVAVEDLRPGDLVRTRDCGEQPVRWIGSCHFSRLESGAPDIPRAIRIKGDALGEQRPIQDLVVSVRFRMLTNHASCAALFGSPETLAPAIDLLDDSTIVMVRPSPDLTFYNLMFDQHQIIMANGLETESYHPGTYGVATMTEELQDELRLILPHLKGNLDNFGPLARPILRGFEAEVLRAG